MLSPEKHSSRKRDCSLAAACLSARKWSRKRFRFARLCRSKTKEKRNIPHNVIPVLCRERHVSLKVKDLSQERLRPIAVSDGTSFSYCSLKSIPLAREMATWRLPACRLGNGPARGSASLASVAVRLGALAKEIKTVGRHF